MTVFLSGVKWIVVVNVVKNMMIGEYSHSIDEGRMALPVKFRHDLKNGAVVSGLDSVFSSIPKAVGKGGGKILNLPIAQANSRAFLD